ncbi:MAG TPA: malonyl-CoA decarboxylase, partial [Alphaproteobacteria bacterium]|nr:malonyl-CoA decarboxylase [Alphaproteobacteria bacterium]
DPVAHFHLTNGARVERLNFLGDLSKNGFRQSHGMMVNYLYKLGDIEKNHERYTDGHIPASGSVRELI